MNVLVIVLQLLVLLVVVLLHVAYATYFERKVIGHMQMRMGPTRVGWLGLLQPIADGIKSFFKEDIIPSAADKPIFMLAPIICLVPAFASLAILPWAEGWALSNINIGLLFVFAMSSLGGYGVVLAGWASNSKFSFLGGLRASAQVISYEIAMGLSLVGVMLLSGSLNLGDIVAAQGDSFFGMFAFRRWAWSAFWAAGAARLRWAFSRRSGWCSRCTASCFSFSGCGPRCRVTATTSSWPLAGRCLSPWRSSIL